MHYSFDTNELPRVRLVGHVVYSNPWSHFSRTLNEYVLYFIRKGELYLQEEDTRYVLKPGDIFILEPNKVHMGYEKSICEYYFIHFKHNGILPVQKLSEEEIMREMIRKRNLSLTSYGISETSPTDSICYLPKHFCMKNSNAYYPNLNEAINEFQRKYEFYKEQVSCRILDFFIRIGRDYITAKTENSEVHYTKAFLKSQSILNLLNKEFHKKITSTYIEQYFESNYDYLNRIFHKSTGYTISNYLNMVRIHKAKELIETTPLKFSEIGYLVGIDNQYYFSKLFKEYAGMTPTQYWEISNKIDMPT